MAQSSRLGEVTEIWRYPIMGLRGEKLLSAEITRNGIIGDRSHAFCDQDAGNVLDPVKYKYGWGETKALPGLLELKAEYFSQPDTHLRITNRDGMEISSKDPEVDTWIGKMIGREVKLMKSPEIMVEKVERDRTIHLLTTASLRHLKDIYPKGEFDVRRFRPNIVLDTKSDLTGFIEEEWLGKTMGLGEKVKLKVGRPNRRCALTTMKQDNITADPEIFKNIILHNKGFLGILCSVSTGGVFRIGDQVSLIS